jgi:hypothetical protein
MYNLIYSVRQTKLDIDMVNERKAWCKKTFGEDQWEWNWETNNDDFYNIIEVFSFKEECYKTWFLLRWSC